MANEDAKDIWYQIHRRLTAHSWICFFITLLTFIVAISLLAFKIDSADAFRNFQSYVVVYPVLTIFLIAFSGRAVAHNNETDTTHPYLVIAAIHTVIMWIITLGWAIFTYFGCVVAGVSFCVDLPWQYWFHVVPVWLLTFFLTAEWFIFNMVRREVRDWRKLGPGTEDILESHAIGKTYSPKLL